MEKREKTIETEEKILQAARKVFLEKGLDGSRMQEIADTAGINKALLHYYFRKKENLFLEIIRRAVKDFFPNIILIWGQEMPFDKKVKTFVEKYITFILENSELPRFFINVLYLHPEMLLSVMEIQDFVKIVDLQSIIDSEAKKGRIIKVDAYQFIITVISLCIFPAIANPLMRMTLSISEEHYKKMMEERKKIVPEIILKWLEFENNITNK